MESLDEVRSRLMTWLVVPVSVFVWSAGQALLRREEEALGEELPEVVASEATFVTDPKDPSGEAEWTSLAWGWAAAAGSYVLREGYRQITSRLQRRASPSAPEMDRAAPKDTVTVEMEEAVLDAAPEPAPEAAPQEEERPWWQAALRAWWWAILIAIVILIAAASGQYSLVIVVSVVQT